MTVKILVAALMLVGAVFCLIGSFGLARFSDFYKRLHGPSKAGTAGVGGVLLGSALWFAAHGRASGHEMLIVLFLFIGMPAAAQLLVQAALKLDAAVRPDPPP